jgi:chromosome segregation ATPase
MYRYLLIGSVALVLVTGAQAQSPSTGLDQQARSLRADIQRQQEEEKQLSSATSQFHADSGRLNARAQRVNTAATMLKLQNAQVQARIDSLHTQDLALVQTRSQLDSRNSQLQSQAGQLRSQQASLRQELTGIDARRRGLDHSNPEAVRRFNAEVSRYNAALGNLKQQAASLRAESQQRSADFQSYNARVAELNRVRSEVRAMLRQWRDASDRNHAEASAVFREQQRLDTRRKQLSHDRIVLADKRWHLDSRIHAYNADPGVHAVITYDTTGQGNGRPYHSSGRLSYQEGKGKANAEARQALHDLRTIEKQWRK